MVYIWGTCGINITIFSLGSRSEQVGLKFGWKAGDDLEAYTENRRLVIKKD